ncbi:MAG: 3-hydroxybutyryl-CoA dehydrogenase [Deferribacterota bacterium]|nr:3-hydroxybutyryl-CoA dehydrogenase [Deferribacterota bacterium]
MAFIIGVVGAGQMGSGIAYVCALNGFKVELQDISSEQLEKSLATIESNLKKQSKKGTISDEQVKEALGRINRVNKLDELKDASIIIEAATEKEDIKIDIFRKLDEVTSDEVILASNTSSISITKIAAATSRPSKVIGMHFMNPVPVMKLVEVIRGLATSDETYQFVVELAKKLGKEPVLSKDYAGFIVNRILIPMINEAIFTYYEGIGTIEDIDKAMKLGTNQPMGPFTLADFIGLDTVLYILEILYNEFKDPKYRPCPLLYKMVSAGYFGRKSGKGFYNYE